MSIGKGENTAIIQLKLKLLNLVNKHCGDEKQSRGFYIAKRWLMFDPELRQELGEEDYQELLKHYSKTNIEQQAQNALEKQAKEIRAQAREEMKAKIEELKQKSPEQRSYQQPPPHNA